MDEGAGLQGDGQVELVKVVVNDPVQVKVKEAMVRWRNGLMEVSGWCLSLWTDKVCVWMSHTAVAATLDLNGPALSKRGHLAFVQSVGK